ncbi:GDNF-inducible zinc finger protein 1-like isoform X1 [Hyposmocoma kahamanoa]|uniref:GDNF-inducible zinc finger protein 1-like isoform X1 n=1 Tax=Hyposmocoma kahamanoa TaxID=1477025 RepID=UPI000E6D916C|nr:GDNF-inducible zinc finger protein 1-like isoform X1 [Hyposmocoma kahamanoa]
MVVCAVKLCRNYTGKNIKHPEGISFHRFPTDKDQKEEWIRAIRREPTWAPGTHCRICSVHFDNSDFKISETGRRILHKDAIPTKNLYLEERSDMSFKPRVKKIRKIKPATSCKDDHLLACRTCLATDTALFELHENHLVDTLARITDIVVSPADGLPQHLCSICMTLLMKCSYFKMRCHDAKELLEQAVAQGEVITTSYLRTIDRRSHHLILPLTTKRLPNINYVDDVAEPTTLTDRLADTLTDLNEMNVTDCVVLEPVKRLAEDFDNGVDISDLSEVKEETDYFDMQTNNVMSTDDDTYDAFDDTPLIQHKQQQCMNNIKTEYDAALFPTDVKDEFEKKKRKKRKREERDVKKKKIKKEKLKEDIRNTKPRKTEEDYERFSTEYNVDIIFLTKEEQINEVIARRESDNYKNSRFKCELCFKGFTGEAAFRNHKGIHDPSVGSYECEACKFRFPKRYKLLHHLTQHKMNFVCRLCGHTSKLPSKAMEHFKWHNGVKYPCHFCDRVFIKRTSQFNHMRNRHGSASCDICQEIFSGERGLLSHMQKAHKEAVKSRCELCNVQFHTEMALNRHYESAPGGCGPHVKACAECGENYPSEETLNDHMKMNHWREIKCEKCNANFENEKLYRMHRVIHKETRNRRPRDAKPKSTSGIASGKQRKPKRPPKIQRRMCEMCGLTWRSAAALKYHQRVHTGEKPHQCPLCPKSFRIQDSLQIHMNTHTGARPFKCPHCPKAFKSRTQNHKHQLVHTKVRRYRCDLCDKTFQTSTCVKTHIKTVHMKIPQPPRARHRPRPPEIDTHPLYMHKVDGVSMESQ